VPLPPCALAAIADVTVVNDRYFFWSGKGDPKTTVADWQRTFRRLCELANVSGHFHMIRDTAAVGWLTKGVPLETVSVLLGHSSIRITEKHYAPWVGRRPLPRSQPRHARQLGRSLARSVQARYSRELLGCYVATLIGDFTLCDLAAPVACRSPVDRAVGQRLADHAIVAVVFIRQ
jgi:hypothetical protein